MRRRREERMERDEITRMSKDEKQTGKRERGGGEGKADNRKKDKERWMTLLLIKR